MKNGPSATYKNAHSAIRLTIKLNLKSKSDQHNEIRLLRRRCVSRGCDDANG